MREVTSHKVSGLNDSLRVVVLDEPGPGGACHEYAVDWSVGSSREGQLRVRLRIPFQTGPVTEAGVNGISNETLLAIVEDRLKCFQSGSHPCRENALALTHLQEALHWLHHRTRERAARGVEGTSAQ